MSFLFGGVADSQEQSLPFSPYLGLLAEIVPHPNLRVGGELGLGVGSMPGSCSPPGPSSCGSGSDLTAFPRVSGQVRLEGGIGGARPFVEGMVGHEFLEGADVRGLGIGVRFPSLLVANGTSLRVRRLEHLEHGQRSVRWEVVMGLGML